MKTIVVANQKGGVAKTTTAGALATGLSIPIDIPQLAKNAGQSIQIVNRVLVIDMDPQGNFTDNCAATQSENGVYAVLKQQASILDCVQELPFYDILPASILLAAIEQELSSVMGREYRLREALLLPEVIASYDYVVIDTPPALGTLTVNALVAADEVLIPAMADINAIKGIRQLNETIQNVRKYFNPGLKISGILMTRFDPRLKLSRAIIEIAKKAAAELGTELYTMIIRAAVSAPEANYNQLDLFSYAPDSTVVQDYSEFIRVFLKEVR